MRMKMYKKEKSKRNFKKNVRIWVFASLYIVEGEIILTRQNYFYFMEDSIMRKIKTIMAFLTAITMTMGVMNVTAYAEEKDTNSGYKSISYAAQHIVIAESDDYVLLDGGTALSRNDFQKLSGSDRYLTYGDVIEISSDGIAPMILGKFRFNDESYIKYLGTLSDVYNDNIKELTVTKTDSNKCKFDMKDAEGTEYTWEAHKTYDYSHVGEDVFNCVIDPNTIHTGDILSCAISEGEVVLPVSVISRSDVAAPTLKGDADLSGTVDLADLTAVAKYSLSNSSYPLANDTAYANADMNGDGKVDGLDLSALIENQLGKKKEELTPVVIPSGKTVELTADLTPVSIQSSKPSDKFNDSQIGFAVELLKNTLETDSNTLVSPYSASQALAMTANGAQKNTLKELMNVIGGGMDIDSFNYNMAGFSKNQPNTKGCKLLTANSIWYHNNAERFTPYEEFLKTNKSYYDAQIYAAPMNDETVNDINSWVKKHTDGMIPKIIEKLDRKTIMALVNAVTFDAKWETPYTSSREVSKFFSASDGSMQDAEVLSKTTEMPYFSNDEATGFIKYYSGRRYAFAAILPNEDISVYKYVNSLTADKLSSLLSSAVKTEVSTQMPKFSVDYSKELNDALKAMGVKVAFDLENADFHKMGVADIDIISISKVLQKTHIDVDEDGTKAAAATAVIMTAPTCLPVYKEPKQVVLDRPFVYAIIDTETNIPIFMGTLNTLK